MCSSWGSARQLCSGPAAAASRRSRPVRCAPGRPTGGHPAARTRPRRRATAPGPAPGSGPAAAARRRPAGSAPPRTHPVSAGAGPVPARSAPRTRRRRPAGPGSAAHGPMTTAGPWPRVGQERRRDLLGRLGAPEPEVGIDELGSGREVDIGDRDVLQLLLQFLEVGSGPGRVTEAEFELAECADRPALVQPHAQVVAQPQRLGRAVPALLVPALPGQQPGQAGQADGQLGLLAALPGQVDRFPVGGLGDRQPVGSGLVAGDQVEREGQRADRGAGPGGPFGLLEQRAPGVSLPQEQRPGRQSEDPELKSAGCRCPMAGHTRRSSPPTTTPR
jgi:hypothetical protein